ncbi:hypothetical protein F2Q69_00055690 [Brassica cretica]|uniref:Uncharacterized protein n=1 Tax=Brassica cretica TaxID=69181 RepID=A0A8S9N119_BRACR|nr:hypothetical protein F2Q69_00055690 [Brassica cretica]
MKRGFQGSSKKEPADSRTIRKSTREASIDTLQAASIESVNQASNDTIQPMSDNTVHHASIDTVHPASIDTVYRDTVYLGTVHLNTVHPDTVHPVKNDTTCGKTEMIEVLMPSISKREDFEMKPIYIALMEQRPFHGFPHKQSMDHINMFEQLVLFIFNEVPEDHSSHTP